MADLISKYGSPGLSAQEMARRSKKISKGATMSAPRPTLVERAYEGVDALMRPVYSAIGMDERGAYQNAQRLTKGIEDILGFNATEKSARRIVSGDGRAEDYLGAALAAAPLAAKPLAKLAAKGVRKVAPRVAEYLGEARGPAPSTVLEGEVLGPLSLGGPPPRAALPPGEPPLELTAANNIGPLALPQPGPGLPPLASKPRGGQWWPNKSYDNTGNMSPEYMASQEGRYMSDALRRDPQYLPWLKKAYTKYLRNDYGAPGDPLRDLAARGLHYDPDMTPEDWAGAVNNHLYEDKIGHFTVPQNGATLDAQAQELLADAPWLAKQPVTDNIYGLNDSPYLDHFHDEMAGALGYADLPPALTLRPESLSRMSFPQAVEHVGKINQYRVERAAKAQAERLSGPAVHTFKEYPENNPKGLRWVELKAPQFEGGAVPEGFEVRHLPSDPEDTWTTDMWAAMDLRTPDAKGRPLEIDVFNTPEEAQKAVREQYARQPLQDALTYEGDMMGQCAGGYCDDVLSGQSRIFSLRDAKGEPHVTIETSPVDKYAYPPPNLVDQWANEIWDEAQAKGLTGKAITDYNDIEQNKRVDAWRAANVANSPDDIIQIKGKGDRAPKDDYLPFVQDFVKSSQWGDVGDLRNTGLVKLPDGRYITEQQAEEGIAAIPGARIYDPSYLQGMGPETWAAMAHHFQGYAKGGRVTADRGFACKCGTSRFKVKR